MTQQNAALVEQAAAAAESMEEQAYELGQAVSVFKLAHTGNAAAKSVTKPAKSVTKPAKKHVATIAKARETSNQTTRKSIASSNQSKADDWEEF